MRSTLWAAALLTAVAATPVMAQTGTGTGTGTTGTTTAPATRDEGRGNWGWIGLLGLAGLAPLFMRKGRDTTLDRR